MKQHLRDHIVVFENFPGIDRIRRLITSESTNSQETGDDGLTLAGIKSFSRNNYDFGIQAALTDQLAFRFNYDGNKFEEKTIRRIFGHLDNLFNQILQQETKAIENFSLLSMEEKKEILVTFNDTEVQYPRHKTVTQLFHEQVTKTPEYIALCGPAPRLLTLTYRQLNETTTRLAHVLTAKGVTPGDIVPILFEPTAAMVTAILAIMKAGAAFIPLEPLHPRERTAWMIEDSQADILLTSEAFKEKISFDGEIVNCDDEILYNEVKNEIPEKNTPTDFLYIIYTSGTTGKPKGSLIRHENIINYVSWFERAVELTGADRALLTSSYAFDALYTQFYSSLLTGGQLHVIPRETFLLADRLLDYIEAHQITYTKTTPSLFNLIVNSPYFTAPKCRSLRFFMLGGEEINVKDVETARRVCGDTRVMNHYGPTETTIGSVAHFIDFRQFDTFSAAPTIGRPINNTRTYIVDNHFNPVPAGIPGELLLAGDGVGSGYLNRPELTAEKFMPNPFVKREMLYRTGDLALFHPGGKIQFLGRLDHQVKIRGYRIELDEVKNHILKHNDVKDVLVVVKDNDKRGKFITAYFVPGNNLSPQELKGFLAKDLPEYMLPSFFIPLEKIPLTRHNKVDRRALPEPDISTADSGIEALEGETEEIIAGVWSDLLGVEKENIGADTNFFDLGGHSLTAIRLVSKLHRELNVNVPLTEVFKQTTVRELANVVKETAESRFLAITKAEEKEYYPLSSAQKRIFILHRAQDNSRVFNMPRMVVLEGELREDQLENAFTQLIQRHDVFRTSFGIIDNEPVQWVHENVEFKIELKDTAHFVRPFDLSRAPLLRAGVLKLEENKHLLMVDMHHIISDGVSREIVVRALEIFYNAQSLPRLAIQYRDFSEWQNKLFQRGDIKKQEEYWLNQFSGSIPLLELPCDNPRPETRCFAGDSVIFEIEKAETEQLKALATREKTTLFILLLTIYNIFLSKLSGQEDIVVGTVTAGRRHADLEPLVGMFANMLALRNVPTQNKIFCS
ncbi:MAG: amino acid adenylation domain-containing protein, partial [bacterium]|nr:amino acid adenylation domain-containing protein [bacterium]